MEEAAKGEAPKDGSSKKKKKKKKARPSKDDDTKRTPHETFDCARARRLMWLQSVAARPIFHFAFSAPVSLAERQKFSGDKMYGYLKPKEEITR